MKSLRHNGVYIPTYSPIGLRIKFKGRTIDLSDEAENMAVQFVKKFGTPYVEDNVFVTNFLTDFSKAIGVDKEEGYLELKNYDFSEIQHYLEEVKKKTEAMTKEEKKLASQLKKLLRERLKEQYGYAYVDGVKTPLMNWAVEPASIFMSKGKNPLRGRWKRAVKKEEIVLNSSEPMPGWRTVWEPEQMWIAKWPEVFDSTRYKYVWLHPSSSLRQEREQAKFDKALELEHKINLVKEFIEKELSSKDETRRKLATVCWLMMHLGIRVGDEKIAGERGTVGCTTLKPSNVILEDGNKVVLDFMGKDFVHWHREIVVPQQVYENLKEFKESAGNDFIFKGLNSAKVSKFLKEVIPGLSAKVFRTYLAGTLWDRHANENAKYVFDDTPEHVRKYLFKKTNLEVAKALNHKKALPKNFNERLAKKEERLKKEYEKLQLIPQEKTEKWLKQRMKVEKLAVELELMKETAEWNLNTSLTSYIDPRRVLKFLKRIELPVEEVYSKALRDKFSWAIT
jgi:DNA topoisomerase-1